MHNCGQNENGTVRARKTVGAIFVAGFHFEQIGQRFREVGEKGLDADFQEPVELDAEVLTVVPVQEDRLVPEGEGVQSQAQAFDLEMFSRVLRCRSFYVALPPRLTE